MTARLRVLGARAKSIL